MGFDDAFPDLPIGVELEFLWRHDATRLALADNVLTSEERARCAAFRSARRRLTFTMGRLAARTILSRRLECQPNEVPLVVADDGAIEVGRGELFVSISHTDDGAVAAVSPGPVGVDIEPANRPVGDLHAYILSEAEYASFHRERNHHQPVLRAWVAKESVLKGMRTGLRTSPKELVLMYEGGGGRAQHRDGSVWRFAMAERQGFVVAVAYPAEVAPS